MKPILRRDFMLLGASALCCAPLWAANKKPPAPSLSVLNQAGQFAMHTERIGKYWIQIGVGIDVDRARLHMQDSIQAFERLVALLVRSVRGEQMLLIEQRARVFRMAWAVKPAPEGVRRISSLGQDLADLGMKLFAQLAQSQPVEGTRRLSDANEARMLTQRMARLALTRQWGMAAPDVSLVIEQQRKAFAARLEALNSDAGLPENARADLQLARQQWVFVDQALATKEDLKAATQAANLAERERELLDSLCLHLV
ncbi:hypothetical protein GCM10025771_23720 [Niveibacterium umoris]|uniref:NarX-like N-terminal domain-containing protein n=1 Tax=Niveibacterium umoris TaxID=1193620 RepID=A0A840BHJ8_9RHOO|nr:hypothetical protein [Niveibacterium umoris]MBB4012440.1 hypothetical protein [Niveibacterium umoris]